MAMDGEARRSLSAPPAVSPQGPVALTPVDLEDLLKTKLEALCAGLTEWGFSTAVVGTLGDIPEARFGTVYRLPLIDPDNASTVAYLNAREAVVTRSGAVTGDLVRATGRIIPDVFQGRVSLRLQAISIEPHELPERATDRRADHASLSAVRRLALQRRPFPAAFRPSIALLHPASSEAKVPEDFLGALGPDVVNCPVRRVPVSMHDPKAIALALQDVREAIVVVIRGGGDASAFAVFDDPAVLTALGKARAYRVLGLGHSGDHTLAELAADHIASTPAAAGEHVRKGITEASRLIQSEALNGNLRKALAEKEKEVQALEARMTIQFDPPVEEPFGGRKGPLTADPRQRVLVWMAAGAGLFWVLSRVL